MFRQYKRQPNVRFTRSFWRRAFYYLFNLALVCFFIGVIGIIGAYAYFSKDLPAPDQLIQRETIESSKVYDRKGETLLYEIHGDVKRSYVPLSSLPKYVADATIAIEDKNFYSHRGISLRSIMKALYEKVVKGGRLRGASTITQQLVSNAILTKERTWSRKFKEAILSFRIERKFPKEQILELYINEIPYGSVVYGIEAASETFFGKSAKDLTVAQAAVLAALPKGPTYYRPSGPHEDELFARQHVILSLMAQQGFITSEEAELYKQEKINFVVNKESIIAPHFVMYVRDLLASELGENFLERGGLKIITTLDIEKQKFAEEAVMSHAEENKTKWGANNASLVSIEAKTGEILAMVGSVNFWDPNIDGQVNVALRPRQPGSSFKPIVYSAAFKKGYTPDTILYDVPTVFKDVCIGDPNYQPKNYTGVSYGPVTMRKALAGSLNISAVKTLYLTGVPYVISLAEEMGYTTFKEQKNSFCLALVLGGGAVRLLDHVSAFSILAQEGLRHEVASILSVTDSQGNNLLEYKDQSIRVLERDTARMTNNILSDNQSRAFIFGANNKLHFNDRPVAAKTGTTNDYRDAWTLGYTPSLATGVWVGNTRNEEMKKGADGSVIAAPIWYEYMKKALEGTPVETFAESPVNTAEKEVLRGVTQQEVKVTIDSQSGKLASEYTPPSRRVEQVFYPIHDILHYVKKDDPRGPNPANPYDDKQYVHWESALRAWAESQGMFFSEPPTEVDDIHTAENKPNVTIVSPEANETVRDRNFSIDINASAPRGIDTAEYYLDGKLLFIVKEYPFDLNYFFEEVNNGFHSMKVVVYDDLKNFDEDEVLVNMLFAALAPQLSWRNVDDSVTLKKEQFPYSFSAEIRNFAAVDTVDVFYRSTDSQQVTLITHTENPEKESYSFKWKQGPDVGTYMLYVVLTDDGNVSYTSSEVFVTVTSNE